ncbi:MAG: branched-chain amino acid ABC transporter permease [Oscillospiraceae bacterium]|nr:branched-chain amino acid ABC transporter permease [Oscillospiraceae bacterium]
MKDIIKKKPSFLYAAIAVIVALIVPFVFRNSNYVLVVLCFTGIYILAVSGLDICFGYCGQISLGHAAFYCIGAYGTALLHNYAGIPIVFAMIIASVIATFVAALLALPCARLKYHFLALATNAFCNIIYLLVARSPGGVTGDFRGLRSSKISLFGKPLDTHFKFYFFLVFCIVVFLIIKTTLVNSKVGRGFIAVRENTVAADGMGIDVRKYKIIAFATSAFFTSWAGGMYLGLVGFISPETFMVRQSVIFLTMLLFGGSASLIGPIVGAAAAQLMTELLRNFQEFQMLVYGVLLILIVLFVPGGIYGASKALVDRLKYSRNQKKEAEADATIS